MEGMLFTASMQFACHTIHSWELLRLGTAIGNEYRKYCELCFNYRSGELTRSLKHNHNLMQLVTKVGDISARLDTRSIKCHRGWIVFFWGLRRVSKPWNAKVLNTHPSLHAFTHYIGRLNDGICLNWNGIPFKNVQQYFKIDFMLDYCCNLNSSIWNPLYR